MTVDDLPGERTDFQGLAAIARRLAPRVAAIAMAGPSTPVEGRTSAGVALVPGVGRVLGDQRRVEGAQRPVMDAGAKRAPSAEP